MLQPLSAIPRARRSHCGKKVRVLAVAASLPAPRQLPMQAPEPLLASLQETRMGHLLRGRERREVGREVLMGEWGSGGLPRQG